MIRTRIVMRLDARGELPQSGRILCAPRVEVEQRFAVAAGALLLAQHVDCILEHAFADIGQAQFLAALHQQDAAQAFGLDPQLPCHNLMHGANKYGLAALCNLDQLPPTGAIVIAAPLKIQSNFAA